MGFVRSASYRMPTTKALGDILQHNRLLLELFDPLVLSVLLIVLGKVGNVFRVCKIFLLRICRRTKSTIDRTEHVLSRLDIARPWGSGGRKEERGNVLSSWNFSK